MSTSALTLTVIQKCVCLCVWIHTASIFITLCETGVFSHLRVQSSSLSLLPQGSRTGIITSYFFVRPQKTTGLVRELGEKKVKHDTWRSAKGHIVREENTTQSSRTRGRQVNAGTSAVRNNLLQFGGRCHHENMIMSNWLSQRKLQRGHCRALHTVLRQDTKKK